MIELKAKDIVNALEDSFRAGRMVDIERIQSVRLTQEILEASAPYISMNLRNTAHLPHREGKLEFYDTESKVKKPTRRTGKYHTVSKYHDRGNHLIDQFTVSYRTGKFGRGAIVVDNSKTVYSSKGSFNLFDLLWNGTNPYIVPIVLTAGERKALRARHGREMYNQYMEMMRKRERHEARDLHAEYQKALSKARQEAYAERGRAAQVDEFTKMRREFERKTAGRMRDFGGASKEDVLEHGAGRIEKVSLAGRRMISESQAKSVTISWKDFLESRGAKEVQPKMMHFYNRYKERFCTAYARRGIEGDVVKSFRAWVAECIVDGIVDGVADVDRYKLEEALADEIGQDVWT